MRAAALLTAAGGLVLSTPGCSTAPGPVAVVPPAAMAPIGPEEAFLRGRPPVEQEPIDLTDPSKPVRGTAAVEVIDTRAFPVQIQDPEPFRGEPVRVRNFLPPHDKAPVAQADPAQPGAAPDGAPPALGASDGPVNVSPQRQFPAITQTGWVPPDPTLAVGPNHIVTTVNQSIAFYTKGGQVLFNAPLNNTGNPGFFETVGAGGFTFDPKCFYDQYAQRFVVMAPETYGTTEAWICIAVSDDSDPTGVWYKYRTDAVVSVSGQTFWWDYPGFGYDHQAYYVTSNLFGLNQSGWGGVGFRVFNKAPLLNGSTAQFWTLRDPNSASVQAAHHAGSNPATPYFTSIAGNTVRIHAIRDVLTAPRLVSTQVSVPQFSSPPAAPAAGGTVGTIDLRVFNTFWRGGRLWTTHHIGVGGRSLARWYELNVSTWPGGASPTLVQSGNIDPGAGRNTFFPALAVNAAGQMGAIFGVSDASSRIDVAVTGRRADEPAGRTGAPVVIKPGEADGAGRWGDYYGMVVDPVDDELFWGVGMYRASFGWSTWIGSFRVADQPLVHAFADSAGNVQALASSTTDVLANDYSTQSLPLSIAGFDASSARGGAVSRVPGGGAGGRDALRYTAPAGYNGPDSFQYTLSDSLGRTARGTVSVSVFDPATFRLPDATGPVLPGLEARYFELAAPTVLPNFALLTPYLVSSSPDVNFESTGGNFAGSGRADDVGATFEGFFNAPADDLYTFTLTSDDGSRMFVGTTRIIDNDGLHGMESRSATIGLRAGPHRIRVAFFEAGGGAGLILASNRPGGQPQPVPGSLLTRVNRCPGDWNGDGAIDFNDLLEFLNDFNALRPVADLNADGAVDFNDLLEFLNRYNAGC